MADCIMYRKWAKGGGNAFVVEIYLAEVGGTSTVPKLLVKAEIDKGVYDASSAAQKTGMADLAISTLFTNTASLSAPVEVT